MTKGLSTGLLGKFATGLPLLMILKESSGMNVQMISQQPQMPSGPALIAQSTFSTGHSQAVSGVVHDAAHNQILTCGQDGLAILWSEDGQELQRQGFLSFGPQ